MHIAITWKDTLKESIEAKYVLGASETTTDITFISRTKVRYKKMTAYYEDNFDINSNKFTKLWYKRGHFAYVSDYIRAYALYTEGGLYIDSDVKINNDP